jgi:hypothetical protein
MIRLIEEFRFGVVTRVYLMSIVPGHLMTAVGKDEASARCFLKSA